MTAGRLLLPDGASIAVDEKGYLLDPSDWRREVSVYMASVDGLELTPDHWAVMAIIRDYFERFDIEPPMRALIKHVRERLGNEKGSSRYLYRLFPAGPGTQGCRYAGLPRPVSCI